MAITGPALAALAARGGNAQPPAATVLMATFTDNYYLAVTPAGDPFAVALDVPCVAVPLKGKGGLKQRLAADMWELTGRTASSEALASVLNMLEGMSAGRPRLPLAVRTARVPDGRIALDLGRPDGTMALIRPGGGWELSQRAGVVFRRSAFTEPLPLPVPGGNPAAAFGLINIRGDGERALYAACRLQSLIPEATKPVESMSGQPGTGKTGTTRLTVAWTGGVMVPMPKDPRDWAAMAGNAHTLGHDNVSVITNDRSDLFCRAASGDTWAARGLYTDAEPFVMKFSPVSLIINTVDAGSYRGDLVRRGVSHRLAQPERYLRDSDLMTEWTRWHPDSLGWLLDMLAAVLPVLPQVRVGERETMPDFAAMVAAVDTMWGTDGMAAWKYGQEMAYADLVDDDMVAVRITDTVDAPWEGTSRDLLKRLALDPDKWSPRRLSGALDRCRTALEQQGWTVRRTEDTHLKSRRIWLVPPQARNGQAGTIQSYPEYRPYLP